MYNHRDPAMASPPGKLLHSAVEHEEHEGHWLFCPSALVAESPLPCGELISKHLGMADVSSPSSPNKAKHVPQAWPGRAAPSHPQ